MTNEEKAIEAANCPYCRYQAEIEWSPSIAELRAELRAAVDALRALPLDDFDKDMDACDAAEFVDHAGDFFEAMQKARVVVAKHPEAK